MDKRGIVLESLMTYGVTILVVLVVTGATLTHFGVLKPEMFLPEKCIISATSALYCEDASADVNGISLRIQNLMKDDVKIVSIDIITKKFTCSSAGGIISKHSRNDFFASCALEPGDKIKASIDISYERDGFGKTATGTLVLYVPGKKPKKEKENVTEPVENVTEPEEELTCTDSDGGHDYFVKGTVNNITGSFTDFCVNMGWGNVYGSEGVIEYTCGGYGNYGWAYRCPVGYICQDGACVNIEGITCADSDTRYGGRSHHTKGLVIDASGTSYWDMCEDVTHVKEYYCSDGEVRYEVFLCPELYGCQEGSCVPECTDTDGGKDYYVKGQLIIGDWRYRSTDLCADYFGGVYREGDLFERFCPRKLSGGTLEIYNCEKGCQDGACVNP